MDYAIIGLVVAVATLAGVAVGFIGGVKYTKRTAGMAGALAETMVQMVKDKDRLLAEFASRVMAGPDLRAVAETEERLKTGARQPGAKPDTYEIQ